MVIEMQIQIIGGEILKQEGRLLAGAFRPTTILEIISRKDEIREVTRPPKELTGW